MRFNRHLISFRLILDQLSTTARKNLRTNKEKTEPSKNMLRSEWTTFHFISDTR